MDRVRRELYTHDTTRHGRRRTGRIYICSQVVLCTLGSRIWTPLVCQVGYGGKLQCAWTIRAAGGEWDGLVSLASLFALPVLLSPWLVTACWWDHGSGRGRIRGVAIIDASMFICMSWAEWCSSASWVHCALRLGRVVFFFGSKCRKRATRIDACMCTHDLLLAVGQTS